MVSSPDSHEAIPFVEEVGGQGGGRFRRCGISMAAKVPVCHWDRKNGELSNKRKPGGMTGGAGIDDSGGVRNGSYLVRDW